MTTRQAQSHLPPRCPIQNKGFDTAQSNDGLRPLRRSVSDPLTLLDNVDDSNTSMYGPNSPRLRSSSSFSESAIVCALSESVSHDTFELMPRNAKQRHPGQRSRIRKLQYIAQLERTVDVLQTLESDLAVRVASLLQQRVALSVENTKLKQQMATMRREKLIVDGQYQILKKEVKRLRAGLTCFGSKSAADAMQMTFDMENLNLY